MIKKLVRKRREGRKKGKRKGLSVQQGIGCHSPEDISGHQADSITDNPELSEKVRWNWILFSLQQTFMSYFWCHLSNKIEKIQAATAAVASSDPENFLE